MQQSWFWAAVPQVLPNLDDEHNRPEKADERRETAALAQKDHADNSAQGCGDTEQPDGVPHTSRSTAIASTGLGLAFDRLGGRAVRWSTGSTQPTVHWRMAGIGHTRILPAP